MAGKSDIGNFPGPGTTPTDSFGVPKNLHIFQQIALVNSVRTGALVPKHFDVYSMKLSALAHKRSE